MKNWFGHMRRSTIIIICSGIVAVVIAVLGISYLVLGNLAFSGDYVLYGKRHSEVVEQLRDELLKRQNVVPVSFPSLDETQLAGFMVKSAQPLLNVVLCHGHKSAKEFMYAFIDMFPHWNIFVFDFRAHGQSEGQMTSIGCHEYKDVIAATKYFKANLDSAQTHLPLVVVGVSMGGAAALKAAALEPELCDALVIDSTYARLNNTIMKAFSSKSGLPHYPFFPIVRWMFQYFGQCDTSTMNPLDYVAMISKPILFIHSCDDNFISPKNAVKLYAHATHPQSKIWIGPRCRHAWLHTYYKDRYAYKVNNFLYHVLKVAPLSHPIHQIVPQS